MLKTHLLYDDRYIWCGGCGAVFKSFENRVPRGTVRFLADHLFFAYMVREDNHCFRKNEVSWCFVDKDKNTPEYVREFKIKVLGGY